MNAIDEHTLKTTLGSKKIVFFFKKTTPQNIEQHNVGKVQILSNANRLTKKEGVRKRKGKDVPKSKFLETTGKAFLEIERKNKNQTKQQKSFDNFNGDDKSV